MTTLKLAACSLCYLLKWCHGLLSLASCPPSSTTVWQVRQLELWQVRLLPHCHTLSRSCHCVTMIRDKSGMGVAHAGISSSATVFPPVSKSREEFDTTNNCYHKCWSFTQELEESWKSSNKMFSLLCLHTSVICRKILDGSWSISSSQFLLIS